MLFKEFAQNLASVIISGESTDTFTRTLFDAIVSEDGKEIVKKYTNSSYKSFYNGNASISGISKQISIYIDQREFENFINAYSQKVKQNLCFAFSSEIPNLTVKNVKNELASLFNSIILDSAKSTKKWSSKETTQNETDEAFSKYLELSFTYFSTKKTLLYAEKPYPFYDLYVCNDVKYKKVSAIGKRNLKDEKLIHNASVGDLEAESRYIIIEGIGGIGKSMFLTHLFLSAKQNIEKTNKIPLFLSLKDYNDNTSGIVEFLYNSTREFDSNLLQQNIANALQEKRLILLFDGLDEIQSSVRDRFDQDLESFIKTFPGNTIIMTSRPVNSFLKYSKFYLFDIQPLTKDQSICLIQKLDFWDVPAKKSFLQALDKRLYYSHYQFASNPLLLTIMLMTYSSFGEVPAKMHVFYSKAYETMARLHDASKGSFKRPLHTSLSPEEFSKCFANFCARTYTDEIIEFRDIDFNWYMKKVLSKVPNSTNLEPTNFLLDLTNNLCIMYKEGDRYYFIHRSFQEYFAAVYFASEYDSNLNKVGDFFEQKKNRSYTDRTFDMLYDMIPEKIERFIFLPFLEKLLSACLEKAHDSYWVFLDKIYPILYHEEGNTGISYCNESNSFLYNTIIKVMSLDSISNLEEYIWPKQIYDLSTIYWAEVYSEFLDESTFYKYSDFKSIPDSALEDTTMIDVDELPSSYIKYFGDVDIEGRTIIIEIDKLQRNPNHYLEIRNCMEKEDFPLKQEYNKVIDYYTNLKSRTQLEMNSDNLFDD